MIDETNAFATTEATQARKPWIEPVIEVIEAEDAEAGPGAGASDAGVYS
jgi:hypothetical protein